MDNLASLTHSHNIIAAKRKAKRDQVKEVVFDEDARRDFLTGFHKRKVAKADAARKKSQEREKQERLESRREQRRALREQAIENATMVEKAYASLYGADNQYEDDEWAGINNNGEKERDEEYEDDEVVATVTVVEDFDPDSILHGPPITSPSSPPTYQMANIAPEGKTRKDKSLGQKKLKPKKIRYQTNEARKEDRHKQLKRRTEKAERAGGKLGRKTKKKAGSRR